MENTSPALAVTKAIQVRDNSNKSSQIRVVRYLADQLEKETAEQLETLQRMDFEAEGRNYGIEKISCLFFVC